MLLKPNTLFVLVFFITENKHEFRKNPDHLFVYFNPQYIHMVICTDIFINIIHLNMALHKYNQSQLYKSE